MSRFVFIKTAIQGMLAGFGIFMILVGVSEAIQFHQDYIKLHEVRD